MLVAVVLAFFLTLGGFVVTSLQSSSARRFVEEVYIKSSLTTPLPLSSLTFFKP